MASPPWSNQKSPPRRRLFKLLGADIRDRIRDAQHRAEEAEDRHRPDQEAGQRVAAVEGDRVVVGQSANLIIEIVRGLAVGNKMKDVRDAPAKVRALRAVPDEIERLLQLRHLGGRDRFAIPQPGSSF